MRSSYANAYIKIVGALIRLNTQQSAYATVCPQRKQPRAASVAKTGLAMAFKLIKAAQAKWRNLEGANRMPEVIDGIEFEAGIEQLKNAG